MALFTEQPNTLLALQAWDYTGGGTTPTPQPLVAPKNLRQTNNTVSSNSLAWDQSLNATTYELQRGGVTIYTGPNTTYIDTALSVDTAYAYAVRALADTGYSPSPYSAALTARTQAPIVTPDPEPEPDPGVYPFTRLNVVTDADFSELSKETAVPATWSAFNGQQGTQYTAPQLLAGLGTVKGAGNFTFSLAKKPHNVTIANRGNFLASDTKSKKYRAFAEMLDPSLLRNPLSAYVGKQLGLVVEHMSPIEEYVSNDSGATYYYNGLFNIANKADEVILDTVGTSTIMYELVILSQENPAAENFLTTNYYGDNYSLSAPIYGGQAHRVRLAAPEFGKATAAQIATAQNALTAFENSLSFPFSDKVNGPAAFADIASLLALWLTNEVLKNPDGFSHSTYFYLLNGKLVFGPPHDFDQSLPTYQGGVATNPNELWTARTPYLAVLFADYDFRAEAETFFMAALSKLQGMDANFLTPAAAVLLSSGAAERNNTRWNMYQFNTSLTPALGSDYPGAVEQVRQFYGKSLSWLTTQFNRSYGTYPRLRLSAGYILTPTLRNFRTVRLWFRVRPADLLQTHAEFLLDLDQADSSYSVALDGTYTEFSGIEPNFTRVFVDGAVYATQNLSRQEPGRLSFDALCDGNWHCLTVCTAAPLTTTISVLSRWQNNEAVYHLKAEVGAIEVYDKELTLAEASAMQPASGLIANFRARLVNNKLVDETGNYSPATLPGAPDPGGPPMATGATYADSPERGYSGAWQPDSNPAYADGHIGYYSTTPGEFYSQPGYAEQEIQVWMPVGSGLGDFGVSLNDGPQSSYTANQPGSTQPSMKLVTLPVSPGFYQVKVVNQDAGGRPVLSDKIVFA